MNKRTILALSAIAAIVAGLLVVAAPSASAASSPMVHFASARQNTSTHKVGIRGWAFDPARPGKAVGVAIYLNGKYVSGGDTNVDNGTLNRAYGLSGRHGFRFVVHSSRWVSTVKIRVVSTATGAAVYPASSRVTHFATPVARFASARQNMSTHKVGIVGWAFDPARPGKAVGVAIYLNGKYVSRGDTNVYNGTLNRAYGLSGRHGFRFVVHSSRWVSTVKIRVVSKATGAAVYPASSRVTQISSAGARIIAAARKYYKARVPYRYGGTTPRGFDCSGYAQYVYREAKVPGLPRTAEQQRRAVRHLSRSHARPGDLVFYLSGGQAYHVAIYAGHGMQYSAATPHDGLRYQPVWSSAVQYGTSWHR